MAEQSAGFILRCVHFVDRGWSRWNSLRTWHVVCCLLSVSNLLDLLLIFAWFAFVEEFLAAQRQSLRGSRTYKAVLAAAALLFLIGDVTGHPSFETAKSNLEQGMALYEHPEVSGETGPVLVHADNPEGQGFATHARGILKQPIELHIYNPPQL